MEIYRQSFLNWAMEFLVWHVCSIGDRAVQRRYFRVLRQSWLPEQHFDRYPKRYFYKPDGFRQVPLGQVCAVSGFFRHSAVLQSHQRPPRGMRRPHEKGVLVSFKDLLKRILPPPVHAFNREVARILDAVDQSRRETERPAGTDRRPGGTAWTSSAASWTRSGRAASSGSPRPGDEWRAQQQAALDKALEGQAKTLAALSQSLEQSAAGLQKQTDALAEAFAAGREQMATRQQADALNKQAEVLAKQGESLAKTVERARSQAADSARHASEAVWAQIFNNTISESLWLKDKTFSPGRWGGGLPLSVCHVPGAQRDTAQAHPGTGPGPVHPHDRPVRRRLPGCGAYCGGTRPRSGWSSSATISPFRKIRRSSCWSGRWCRTKTRRPSVCLRGSKETFQGQKFDFISVDAPYGGDMRQYSRIDILNLIPNELSENFVITRSARLEKIIR